MQKPNQTLRNSFKAAGVCSWQIAKQAGISTQTLMNWLRDDPLPPDREKRIIDAFDALKESAEKILRPNTNESFKDYARRNKIPLWQIADALGVSEPTITRMLRHELKEDKLAELCSIVDRLAAGEDPEVIRNG